MVRNAAEQAGEVELIRVRLWYTTARAEAAMAAGKGSVKTLAEIRRTLYVAGDPGRLNHRIPLVAPVELAPRTDQLFFSPYLLGLLLADQSLRGLSERPGDADAGAEAERISVSVDGVAARIPVPGRRFSATRLALEHYGLSGLHRSESFIPDDYLRAPPAERLDLLRGLLDADGEVVEDDRAVDFATSSRQLANGVLWLVRSLGGVSREERAVPDRDRAPEEVFRVRIWFPNGIVPITSKKHLERWNGRAHRFPGRFIESVEPIGTRPCQCILVDSDDHLYVTSDFVLTHNTAFCLNIATHVGCRGQFQKKRCGVGIFSLEMPKEQLVMRMLASEARVDSQRIRTGKLIESDWAKLAQAAGVLADANIHIDDTPAVSALELRAKCRRLFAKYQATDQPIRLIVVDYLQLMRGNERLDNREQQISEISRSLKGLAKELGMPVLALSQLNRSLEKRPDKRPMMSDLRESGAIEQDSDTILFIYREEVYEKDKEDVKGVAEIIIGKQRNGPIGSTNLAFIHEHTRFENLARD